MGSTIELSHHQQIAGLDPAVVIDQAQCLLVGRFGLGLWYARSQQSQQRDAPAHGSTRLCKVELMVTTPGSVRGIAA